MRSLDYFSARKQVLSTPLFLHTFCSVDNWNRSFKGRGHGYDALRLMGFGFLMGERGMDDGGVETETCVSYRGWKYPWVAGIGGQAGCCTRGRHQCMVWLREG